MICRRGHDFDITKSLACPICASEAGVRMLRDYQERAVTSGEQIYNIGHIFASAEWWRRILTKLAIQTKDAQVPALCGRLLSLTEITKSIRTSDPKAAPPNRCFECEDQLKRLRTPGAA